MSAGDIAVLEKAVRATVNRGDTQKLINNYYPAWATEFMQVTKSVRP